MMQAHIVVSGYVQGIGFRQFVKQNAKRLGVTGWVKNLPAGRQVTSDQKVEAVLQGKKENIEQVILLCRKGPILAEVKDVVVAWEELKKPFGAFEVT